MCKELKLWIHPNLRRPCFSFIYSFKFTYFCIVDIWTLKKEFYENKKPFTAIKTITKKKNCHKFLGCVRYIFTSLACKSKGRHLLNKEKCFLFHFKSSFCSWGNQILTFRYSNVMASSNVQAWNTKHILLNNLGSKHSLVMKFGQFM